MLFALQTACGETISRRRRRRRRVTIYYFNRLLHKYYVFARKIARFVRDHGNTTILTRVQVQRVLYNITITRARRASELGRITYSDMLTARVSTEDTRAAISPLIVVIFQPQRNTASWYARGSHEKYQIKNKRLNQYLS